MQIPAGFKLVVLSDSNYLQIENLVDESRREG